MLHLLSYHAENFSRVIHLAVSPGLSVFKKRLHAQPPHGFENIAVAPHPGGKSTEIVERLYGILICASPKNITIDAVSVGPVRLCSNCGESLLFDQSSG